MYPGSSYTCLLMIIPMVFLNRFRPAQGDRRNRFCAYLLLTRNSRIYGNLSNICSNIRAHCLFPQKGCPLPGGRGQRGVYFNSESTSCGNWFACASIATPDWLMIWNFVNSAISLAKSASLMIDSADFVFSYMADMLDTW